MDTEIRAWAECRVEASDNKRMIGYAIVFDSPSVDLGGFREIIHPDAVDRTIRDGADVRALVDHDTAKILGRTRSGTLQLRKEAKGLRAIIEPDLGISYAADVMRAVARGDVSGMSFGFRALADDWNYDGDVPVRTVTDMRISEVSVVTFPAYEATDVSAALRSLSTFRETHGNKLAWLEKWHRTRMARG